MSERGKLIVFEGTDGSGKTTQMRLLAGYLSGMGVSVCMTHEPTESPFGALLRACMSKKIDADERAIAALFAADRIDHIQNPETGMLAMLNAGATVLCDRYYFSSYAYNGGFVPLEWVIELNRPARELLRPDLIIYLDLPAEEGMARVGRRGATERYENLERQTLIREKYFEAFERFRDEENIVVIRSERTPEDTQKKIRRAVSGLFGGVQ